MNRAEIDTLWHKALQAAVKADEQFTRYHFAELVADAEAKRMHEEGMVTVGHMRDQIAAEREACAKVCEQGVDTEHPTVKGHIMKDFGASKLLAAAIRARSNT